MLFIIPRIVIWLVASVLVILRIRATNIVRKRLVGFLSVALCLIIVSASAVYPVENLFVDFKSPESVFNYTNFGEVNDIVYGKESCMVIYTDRNSSGGHYIIPRSEKGYKIPSFLLQKRCQTNLTKTEISMFTMFRVRMIIML